MIYLKTSIGVELRGDDMVISSLESRLSEGVFTHFKRIPNHRQRDRAELRREIQSFFKSNRLSPDNIVLGIPRKDIVLRYLDFPSEVVDNLKQVVRYQVQTYEPTEEERYYYDYVLLGGNVNKSKITVLLAMVKKALLDELLQYLHDLGIRPSMVLSRTVGLSNIFMMGKKDAGDKTFILADVSSTALEIIALHHGTLTYSREVAREGDQSWKESVLHEIGEAASKMRLGPNDTLDKIVLAGESSDSALAQIREEIPECELLMSRIPFEVTGENKPHLQEAASSLGLAFTGMVRRPFMKMNLLPPELRIHQTRWAYVPAILLGLTIIVLLLGIGFHRTIQNRGLVRKLDEEINARGAAVARVQSIRDQANELEKRIQSVEKLLGQNDMNLEILRELTAILPSDTYLNTYSYRDGAIRIAGLSGSSSDLISKLEDSPLLKDVETRGPVVKDPRSDRDRFTFEAQLEK
jgi:general secretion pathway protein L